MLVRRCFGRPSSAQRVSRLLTILGPGLGSFCLIQGLRRCDAETGEATLNTRTPNFGIGGVCKAPIDLSSFPGGCLLLTFATP